MPELERGGASIPERLGDFRLLDRLGAGGMGVVYRARDEVLAREVALKLIRPENLHFEEARERFRREVEAAAKLRHPGIVPIYSVGEAAGVPYFAMELVDGVSLADVVERMRGRDPSRLSGADLRAAVTAAGRRAGADPARGGESAFAGTWVQACCRLVAQVADALAHAHALGVLHRDVKPSNVVVTADGRAMLLDFGLASSAEASRITRTGTQVGSLPYMAPERLSGGLGSADARGDVYSLGVSLYELLALRLPFEDTAIERLARAISAGEHAPLRAHNRAVAADAAIVCATAMERDPVRRYGSAEAFARDLRNLVELRPIEARAPSTALRVRRWVQRHPTRSVTALAGFLLLFVAPSVAWWRIREERDVAVRELAVRKEMLKFFLELLVAGDSETDAAGMRSVQDLVDDATARIRSSPIEDPLVHGQVLAELARVQGSLGRPREAVELGRESLAVFDANAVATSASLRASMHRHLGSALGQLGEYDESERELERAAALAGEPGTADDLALQIELEFAANDLRRQRLDAAAARLDALAADPQSAVHGEGSAARSWLSIHGELARQRGDGDVAERDARRKLDIARRVDGPGHPQVARELGNLAAALLAQGRFADAVPLLIEAREVRARAAQREGLEDARLAFNLAAAYSRLERLADAASEFERALKLCRSLAGDSLQTAKAAAGMGSVLVKAGDLERAEPVLREALELSRRFLPRQGWSAADAPIWLARCLVKLGKPDEAVERFEETLACLDETAYGRPDLAAKIEGELADALASLGRADEAERHRERQRAWLADD